MGSRREFCQRVMRNVYGDFPSADSSITENLVNSYLGVGIGMAARNAYRDSIQIDGISYINNSFYTTFKGLTLSKNEQFLYQMILPQIPVGIGKNEGVASLNIKTADGSLSYDAIPINANQVGYYRNMSRKPPRLVYYSEGIFAYVFSVLQLNIGYTANIRMISGGDSSNLDSVLNIPADYETFCFDYCVEKLRLERNTPKDILNDGNDN